MIGVDAVITTLAPSTARAPTRTPSTTIERDPSGGDVDTPWADLPEEAKIVVLEGSGTEAIPGLSGVFEGVRPWLARKLDELATKSEEEGEAGSPTPLEEVEAYLGDVTCPICEGQRLRLEARMVRVGEHNIAELCAMPIRDLARVVAGWSFSGPAREIAEAVLGQVVARLHFLGEVGLGYLTLDRPAMTLSGGESQRIRLATQVGAALVGVTYILDEPSIGLHQRDNERLVATLLRLRDLGNSVIVVEHDEDTIRAADHIVDMGPGAGTAGGRVVAQGSLAELLADPRSPTGAYLSGRLRIEVPASRRRPSGPSLVLRGARGHNLRNVTVRFPLGLLTCVTGVSGSGKSSLVIDTLLPEARRVLAGASSYGLPHDGIDGFSHLDKVIHVDQSPIGRTARSNPATYTGILTELRQVFA
jgi:excinuclease ABC subunit A